MSSSPNAVTDVTPKPLLLAPSAAAEVLDVGRTTLYQLLADGKLKSVYIGRARRIPYAELERFVDELRGAAADA